MWPQGLRNGCASALAAACAKTILQPFDCIKTLQQANVRHLSMIEAMGEIMQRSGPMGLYSGLHVNVLGALPSVFVYFGVYQGCKRRFVPAGRYASAHGMLGVAAAAAIGNAFAAFLRPPYEIVKQRLQAGQDLTLLGAIHRICVEDGAKGFWRGTRAQLVRDVPYAVFTLLTYEIMKYSLLAAKERVQVERERVVGHRSDGTQQRGSLSAFEFGVLGALAGGVGSLLTNPMDVIKTRIMTGQSDGNVLAVTLAILRDEGTHAFLKGSFPRLLHKMPANAIFFLAYELFRRLFHLTL